MTSKHDSWVWLKDDSRLSPILPLFPQGFPVRDPFPMQIDFDDNQAFALWVLDSKRLELSQRGAFCQYLANGFRHTLNRQVSPQEVLDKWLCIPNEEIALLEVGKEGLVRTLELNIFMSTGQVLDLNSFYDNQTARWIDGNESPDDVMEKIDDDLLKKKNLIELKTYYRRFNKSSREFVPVPPIGQEIERRYQEGVVIEGIVDFLDKPLTANLN